MELELRLLWPARIKVVMDNHSPVENTVNPRYNESTSPDDLIRYIGVFVIMRYDERLFYRQIS